MKKYYIIYLLPMILASAGSLFAQATVWNGFINSDWSNPSNWSGGVPNGAKDAYIFTSGNNPVISAGGATAKSLYITGGSLTITTAGALAINGGTTSGIYNDLGSTVTNSGVLNIGNTFVVSGTYSQGIYNQGVFNNTASGQITVDRAATGLDNRSTFNNYGTISIGQIAGVSGNGLYNQAAFNNFTGGQIHIDKPSLNAIQNQTGTFTNQANITIGEAPAVGSTGGIENRATFNNTAGEIKIDRTFTFGLKNLNGTFTNQATITIGSALSTGVTGLENNGGTFNNTGGSITINRNNTTGLKNFNTGTINNTGSIVLGNIASPVPTGIDNQAFFNNNSGGQIRIDQTSGTGISNLPGANFNNNATIIIGATAAVGFYGINNEASFNNNAGGQVTIDRTSSYGIRLANGFFYNRADLTIGEITPITTLIGAGAGSGFSNLTGGILKGTGTILTASFDNAGGTLSPGYSPGKMTFSTEINFANSTLDIDVNGTGTPGIDFDQVVVPGFATLTATTKLNLVFGYQAVNGASFDILSANGVTGAGISPGNITISNTGAGNVTAVTLSNPGGNTLRVTVTAVALPVEMVRFNGKQMEHNVLLDWETASEKNNSGFFIERSADGRNWNEIGFVGGNGTSNEPHTYTFVDQTPLSGPNLYRLRQTDFDGKIEFSDIVIVQLSGSTSGFTVFPNPASDGYLTVNFTGETTESDLFVRMFNTKGQVVQTDLLYGESGRIDVHNLTPGIYLLEMSSQGKHFWEKVVLAPH